VVRATNDGTFTLRIIEKILRARVAFIADEIASTIALAKIIACDTVAARFEAVAICTTHGMTTGTSVPTVTLWVGVVASGTFVARA
jgi:hypothetical protein